MDYAKLSKEVSYALRHAPWEYELEMDDEGWVSVDQLLHALRADSKWESLLGQDFERMLAAAEKKRFEISNGRIRAFYGHSVPDKINKTAGNPPATLYHGTARHTLEHIVKQGLKPMNRQYVHCSEDQETALTVGKRRDAKPVLLKIDAARASAEGVPFYHGNHNIWLADAISPNYISIDERGSLNEYDSF
ncbi:putative RNA 2'-phosphotransferase [Paenibacillus taihuensis]|uniref:Probable RNA 2'-phosphotransferase n=1 Tax=Paenibacillus taihuensis TaxID=1156355 RepID=A0A3D9SMF5_9BACL|nr:RNA 2'-phosphotransferase [Paenibacillus taihuensis]REE92744.1 putative RNA 2'-phosphotransferase [Paenibacillus taihuensis]